MPIFLDPLFTSVAFGHLIVDVLNGQRSVLMTYWREQLGFPIATLSIVSMVYVWVASLSQPLFGWMTDRVGARWMAAGGILWMTGLFSLALLLPIQAAIPCLILASLGSAAFHPAGTMQATTQGIKHYTDKETTATSLFFVFGQLGYFFGPIIGGPLLDIFGPTSLLALTALAVPIGLNAAWQLRHLPRTNKPVPPKRAVNNEQPISNRTFLVILAIIAALQSWAQQNMVTFIPPYLSDLGQPAAVYGLTAGLFMGGSAMGNVIGGNLADRFGKKRIAMLMLALAGIPIFTISQIGWSAWLYALVPISGLFTGAVHSIIVVLAQRTIRSGLALASGLILGYMFSSGALGTLVSGLIVDRWGFSFTFQMTAGLVLLGAILTSLLRAEPARQKI